MPTRAMRRTLSHLSLGARCNPRRLYAVVLWAPDSRLTLREWLGHKGTERLRAYLVHMNNEEAIESGKIDAGYAALRLAGGHGVPVLV